MKILKAVFLFSAFAHVVLHAEQATADPLYHVTGLGMLPGATDSQAFDINSAGQIVGMSLESDGDHAFLYSNGVMSDLGSFGGGQGFAAGINGTGQITGEASNTNGDQHAYSYTSGVMTDLGNLGGGNSFGHGINDSGQIAGYSNTAGFEGGPVGGPDAFLYSNGTMSDLGTLGGDISYAFAINNSGQVVGSSNLTTGGAQHAFSYQNGTMTDLGTLPSGLGGSQAEGINDGGQIVGYSSVAGSSLHFGIPYHAFLYSNGTMQDLGTLPGDNNSWAYGINSIGQIVGFSENYVGLGVFTDRAMLYSNGVMVDLTQLLDSSGVGWSLKQAFAINDNGWIVGQGINPNGQTEAFVLTPVPEPCSVVLAFLGLLSICGRCLRRHQP